jgi:hypothetical protein
MRVANVAMRSLLTSLVDFVNNGGTEACLMLLLSEM